MLLPSEASEHDHGQRPCPGPPHNRATAEFVYYMAHIENAARIICWGLYAHHWAKSLPGRKVIADSNVMRRFGRRKHRKFVNLYFGTHTAMQHVLTQGNSRVLFEKDLVFLRFNSDDLFGVEDTKFSDGNVARHETLVYSAEEQSEKMDNLMWGIILCQKNYVEGDKGDWIRRVKMAELLVPHYISPSQIHSAVVLNSESEKKLNRLIKKEDSEKFLNAMIEIEDESKFCPENEPPSEANMKVDIIRDGARRHFFDYGDGGYNVDNEWDVESIIKRIRL